LGGGRTAQLPVMRVIEPKKQVRAAHARQKPTSLSMGLGKIPEYPGRVPVHYTPELLQLSPDGQVDLDTQN